MTHVNWREVKKRQPQCGEDVCAEMVAKRTCEAESIFDPRFVLYLNLRAEAVSESCAEAAVLKSDHGRWCSGDGKRFIDFRRSKLIAMHTKIMGEK